MFLSGLVLIGLALAASYLSRVPDRSADGRLMILRIGRSKDLSPVARVFGEVHTPPIPTPAHVKRDRRNEDVPRCESGVERRLVNTRSPESPRRRYGR